MISLQIDISLFLLLKNKVKMQLVWTLWLFPQGDEIIVECTYNTEDRTGPTKVGRHLKYF